MIIITGDTHGDVQRFRNSTVRELAPLENITHSIILGDFGLIWTNEPSAHEAYWINWLNQKPYETLTILGNHENYERIYALPQEERYGSPVYRVSDKVFILQHGYKYVIENQSFFVFGGADSIDKQWRKDRITWWQEEIPTNADFRRGLATCEANDFTFDYVLTHTAPSSAVAELKRLKPEIFLSGSDAYERNGGDPTTRMLEAFVERIRCKRWYFGHFHSHVEFTWNQIPFTLMFEDVRGLG